MSMRSFTSVVVFKHPFVLPGSPDVFPAGRYEVLVEEELLDGLSFPAFRETAAHLMIFGSRPGSGPSEMRATSTAELDAALRHDAELEGAGKAGLSSSAEDAKAPGAESDVQPQPQSVQPVQERLEQWINTLTAPLPH